MELRSSAATALYFLCIILLAAAGPGCFPAIGDEKPKLVVGYSTRSLPEVDLKDATAALNVWTKELGGQEGFQTDSQVYDETGSLIKDMKGGKTDLAIIQTVDYLRIVKEINAEPAFVKTRQGKVSSKFHLLVRTDLPHSGLADLKGKRLAVLKHNDLGMIFLNTQLLKAKQPEASLFFGQIQEKSKESQAILAVFFGQADTCLVSEIGFNAMVEINPQVGKKLAVLSSSSELVETVALFRRGYEKAYQDRVIRGILKLKDSPRGRQLMMLFNFDGLTTLKDDQLESARRLIAEYGKLKGKK